MGPLSTRNPVNKKCYSAAYSQLQCNSFNNRISTISGTHAGDQLHSVACLNPALPIPAVQAFHLLPQLSKNKMDVVFEISKGRQFAIELGFFDTVLEMKEKIQKYEGFPVAQQTLVFRDQVMMDDRDTEFYEIIQGSHIRLFIEPETVKPTMKEEPSKIHLTLRISASKRQFSIDVDATCSVAQLKERIHEMEGIPSSRLALLIAGNTELQDHRSLSDYGIFDDSDVNVIFKPFPPPTQPPLRRLKVTVQSMCGTKKVPVEVNASDNVCELRKELERMHQHNHLHLPQDGYFFIFKQNVMEDDRTFRWHDVRQGDVIEIFNGSVTGGS